MIKEAWDRWSKRQRIIFVIYFLLSLPLFPFYIVMIPFAHWITWSANRPYKRITVEEFLCMAAAMTVWLLFMIVLPLHYLGSL